MKSIIPLRFRQNKECPICGWRGNSFVKKSYPYKPAICLVCPKCDSYERHRFIYLALKDMLPRHTEKVLHIAPERCLESWLRSISKEYISMDLSSKNAMVHMDITTLGFPDDRFSVIWCSHVLEHIENDHKAMLEIHRVLQPTGLAIIQVPIYGDRTYENHNIRLPEERLKHFKQADHVRLYGLDIKNRLEDVGFVVNVLKLSDMPASSIAKYVLDYPSTREIFICKKHKLSNV